MGLGSLKTMRCSSAPPVRGRAQQRPRHRQPAPMSGHDQRCEDVAGSQHDRLAAPFGHGLARRDGQNTRRALEPGSKPRDVDRPGETLLRIGLELRLRDDAQHGLAIDLQQHRQVGPVSAGWMSVSSADSMRASLYTGNGTCRTSGRSSAASSGRLRNSTINDSCRMAGIATTQKDANQKLLGEVSRSPRGSATSPFLRPASAESKPCRIPGRT